MIRPFKFSCGDGLAHDRYLPGREAMVVYLDDAEDLLEQVYELVSDNITWLEDTDLARAICWVADDPDSDEGEIGCLHIYDTDPEDGNDLLATLKPLDVVPVADCRQLEISL